MIDLSHSNLYERTKTNIFIASGCPFFYIVAWYVVFSAHIAIQANSLILQVLKARLLSALFHRFHTCCERRYGNCFDPSPSRPDESKHPQQKHHTPAEQTSDDSTKDAEDISVKEARSPAEKPHEDSLTALRTE